MSANDTQVGGDHYRGQEMQHWDLVTLFGWDYFQGQIIKYVMRHAKKNGRQDLEKAAHFLEKYLEVRYPVDIPAHRAPYGVEQAREGLRLTTPTEHVTAFGEAFVRALLDGRPCQINGIEIQRRGENPERGMVRISAAQLERYHTLAVWAGAALGIARRGGLPELAYDAAERLRQGLAQDAPIRSDLRQLAALLAALPEVHPLPTGTAATYTAMDHVSKVLAALHKQADSFRQGQPEPDLSTAGSEALLAIRSLVHVLYRTLDIQGDFGVLVEAALDGNRTAALAIPERAAELLREDGT